MADLTENQLRKAEELGREMLRTEPRAVVAHFDSTSGRVVVDLVNGCAYAFPPELVQELRGASSDDLARVEVDGVGFNLHWPKLNLDLYVPALVSGIFGTRAWMASEFARLAGRARSPTKAAAARANGAKGGRHENRRRQADLGVAAGLVYNPAALVRLTRKRSRRR